MTRQFAQFILAGGVAAAANWLSRIALSQAMPLEAAVVVAYLIGMATAYALTRRFVFAASGRTVGDETLRFAAVNAVALVQVWLVTIGLARFVLPPIGWDWHAEAVAHAFGVASPVVTSYFGHRYFTFARKPATTAPDDPAP